jgi:hypothetical protein
MEVDVFYERGTPVAICRCVPPRRRQGPTTLISDYECIYSLSSTSKVDYRLEIVTTFGLTRQNCLFSWR